MTRRLAIVAHYDPRGEAAPHFLRQLETLATAFDRLISVTTVQLTPTARAAITARSELIERRNFGHDFGSWRDVLVNLDYGRGFDEILLTNDSYVGYLADPASMIEKMQAHPTEVWGITKSYRHEEHIQSYFLYFTEPAATSPVFRRFWADLSPARDRASAIMDQEMGLSRYFRQKGFRLGAYFAPTAEERLRANHRGRWWMRYRMRAYPGRYAGDEWFDPGKLDDLSQCDGLNTNTVFADSALLGGRLPVVKFDTLRHDHYFLDSPGLLELLERHLPTEFAGVRDFIVATAASYRHPAYDKMIPVRMTPRERRLIAYSDVLPDHYRRAAHNLPIPLHEANPAPEGAT